ncbi:MAG: hypothetical protein KIH67_000335 [Candidatus Moranbacteria bacterium]|nr:hypothetical protein [Candidatus Moranbacteria bacterium]
MLKGLSLLGLLIVIGVGAYFYTNQTDKEVAQGGAMEALDAAKDIKTAVEEKGMVSSIKDAMGLGTAMKCTYTTDATGKSPQSEVLVEGEKFQATTTINGIKSYVLSDGTDQYMWTDGSKQGMKMSKVCMDDFKKAFPTPETQDSKQPKVEDAKAALDMAKNVQCTPAESANLSVPKDITFTDQCAMMKDSMKALEKMKDKMPAGITIPAQQ